MILDYFSARNSHCNYSKRNIGMGMDRKIKKKKWTIKRIALFVGGECTTHFYRHPNYIRR